MARLDLRNDPAIIIGFKCIANARLPEFCCTEQDGLPAAPQLFLLRQCQRRLSRPAEVSSTCDGYAVVFIMKCQDITRFKRLRMQFFQNGPLQFVEAFARD